MGQGLAGLGFELDHIFDDIDRFVHLDVFPADLDLLVNGVRRKGIGPGVDRLLLLQKGLEVRVHAEKARADLLKDSMNIAKERARELAEKNRPYFRAKRDLDIDIQYRNIIRGRILQEMTDAEIPSLPGLKNKRKQLLQEEVKLIEDHVKSVRDSDVRFQLQLELLKRKRELLDF